MFEIRLIFLTIKRIKKQIDKIPIAIYLVYLRNSAEKYFFLTVRIDSTYTWYLLLLLIYEENHNAVEVEVCHLPTFRSQKNQMPAI